MGDGLVGLPAAGQSVAQVVVGFGIIGADLQGLPVMAMASSNCPRPARAKPEVVVGLREVGLDFQGLPVMVDCLVDLPVTGQDVAEVVVGRGVVGTGFPGPCGNGRWPRQPARGQPERMPRLLWASA